MTPAEKALIEAVLATKDWSDYSDTDFEDQILAVREERCPSDMVATVRAAMRERDAAVKAYEFIIGDLKLNHPPEVVDAACSKARKELRDERLAQGST